MGYPELQVKAQDAVDELLSEKQIPSKLTVECVVAAPIADPADSGDYYSIGFSDGQESFSLFLLWKRTLSFKDAVRDAILQRYEA